jgi:hypothetical protein
MSSVHNIIARHLSQQHTHHLPRKHAPLPFQGHIISPPTPGDMASFLIVLPFVFNLFSPTAAAPGSVCSSGIYKPLLELSAYAPAESYCSAHYPLSTSTVTTTVSAGSSKRSNIFGRAACSVDNCLRALQNKGETATSDCKKATGIPSYASPCSAAAKYDIQAPVPVSLPVPPSLQPPPLAPVRQLALAMLSAHCGPISWRRQTRL